MNNPRNKFILLALVFGIFGFHWFYTKRYLRGTIYLLVSLLGMIVLVPTVFIFGLSWVDAIKASTLDSKTFSQKYSFPNAGLV